MRDIMRANLCIEKINDKDEKEWKVLFDTYYAPLCAFANEYLHDDMLAEDIIQTTLMKLWNNDKTFDNAKHLSYYLYRAVYNNVLYHLRVNQHHIDVELSDSVTHEWSDDDFSLAVKEELVRQLYEGIQLLPKRRREVIMLSIQGKSGAEIAEILQISVNTVKASKARAIDALKKFAKDNPILYFL